VICNAAGLAALEAAIEDPQRIRGVFITNISLRMLHASKQSRCFAVDIYSFLGGPDDCGQLVAR
jgi:hypothetical protein